MAFDSARQVSDVLEIDIHRTLDGEFVVWHGPRLGNVYIEGKPGSKARGLKISDLEWAVLQNAWVASPTKDPHHRYTAEELDAVPRKKERQLLLLREFLREYSRDDVNIELKRSIKKKHIPALLELVGLHRGDRTILFVSFRQGILNRIHDIEQKNPYPTGLSFFGNVRFVSGIARKELWCRAVQTSHVLACTRFVRRAKTNHAAFHIFLSGFGPFPAIDSQPETPSQKEIDKFLRRGVDGIMTDRPGHVRKLIDDWVRRRSEGLKV